MLELVDKAAIYRLWKSKDPVYSIRGIAKALHMPRKTVTKYVKEFERLEKELEAADNPIDIATIQQSMLSKNKMDVSKRHPRKFVGEVKIKFLEIIKTNDERNKKIGPNKQEINSAIIHRELIKCGYDVGESTVRKWYRDYKSSLPKEVYIKQSYEYGDRVEFDFHVIKLIIAGEVRKFHQATISCPASNFIFVRLFKGEKTASVLTGLIEFFRYAGGVPKEVTFDNLKPVVKVYGYKSEKELTEEIIKFSAYYGFNVNTCNARKGNEKGHVENSGDNARANLFSLKYEFSSIKELNTYVLNELESLNKNSLDKFEEEKKYLKELPLHDYTIGKFGIAKSDSKYCMVCIDTNHYSVPEEYIGKEIRYSIINDIIVFYYGNKEICRHKKIEDTNSYSVNIRHYLKTLYKKPGALARSLALKQADEEVISIYQQKYINDQKGFIDFLFNKSDKKIDETIESASKNQLDQINKAYSLGVN